VGQSPQEVTATASHIEDALRRGRGRCCQRRGAVTDGVMQPTAPAPVIVPSTIVISSDVTVGRHDADFRFVVQVFAPGFI
jgi:hypothetical protein